MPAFVLKVQTLPATGIEENKATLQGSFDPDNIPTEYWFEYGVTTAYGQETAKVDQGSAPGEVVVGSTLTGLPRAKSSTTGSSPKTPTERPWGRTSPSGRPRPRT